MSIEYQGNGIQDFSKMFTNILEMGGHQLNQYVHGDSMGLPENVSDEFVDALKEFIDAAPMQISQIEDKDSFWQSFEQMQDYEKNDKFISWLKQYVEQLLKSWEDAVFINKLSEDKLRDMVNYCFEKLILKYVSVKAISTVWDAKQLNVLRNILLTYFDMIIMYQYTCDYAFESIQKRFGISNACCAIFQNLVEKNEERLWKIMVSKKLGILERRLDDILEIIS